MAKNSSWETITYCSNKDVFKTPLEINDTEIKARLNDSKLTKNKEVLTLGLPRFKPGVCINYFPRN